MNIAYFEAFFPNIRWIFDGKCVFDDYYGFEFEWDGETMRFFDGNFLKGF